MLLLPRVATTWAPFRGRYAPSDLEVFAKLSLNSLIERDVTEVGESGSIERCAG